MGKFKDRVTTTVTADLVRWRRVSQYEFIGTIYNSIDQQYIDNHLVRISFMSVCSYPTLTGHWDEHYIGKNIEGSYFRMEAKHELKIRPST